MGRLHGPLDGKPANVEISTHFNQKFHLFIQQAFSKAHCMAGFVPAPDTKISPPEGFLSSRGRQMRTKLNPTEGHVSAVYRGQ